MPRHQARPDTNGTSGQARRRAAIKRLPAVCVVCKKPIDTTLDGNHPDGATREHIVPVANGGHPTDPSNEGLSHRRCNTKRGTRPLHQVQPTAPDPHSRQWT